MYVCLSVYVCACACVCLCVCVHKGSYYHVFMNHIDVRIYNISWCMYAYMFESKYVCIYV